MSFCFGTPGKSGGHAVQVRGVGVGVGVDACRPAKFKEPGLSIVPGSNCSAFVIMEGHTAGGGKKRQ